MSNRDTLRLRRVPGRALRHAIAFGIVVLLVLSGCDRAVEQLHRGESSPTAETAVQSDQDGIGPVRIGFSIASDTFIIERWNKDIKVFTSAAQERGAEVLMQMSAGGTDAQVEQVRYLLSQEIDVLVILPHDTDELAGVAREALNRGIPVISYDRLIQGVPVTAYISFDNEEVGRLFGRALTEEVPRGRYLIVNGSIRDNNSYRVNSGLYEIIQPLIDSGAIEIVDELWLDAWSSDEATQRIRTVMERTTDIDAISAANDQIANAAIRVLSEYRIAGRVAVVGQDADLISSQRVVEGLQLMTVYKPIHLLASRAAALAVAVAADELPEPDRMVTNGSGADIPYYIEDPVAVYSWNMDETIIRDGFHSAEDVYRTSDGISRSGQNRPQ